MSNETQTATVTTQTAVAEAGRPVRTTSANIVIPSAHSTREARRGLLDFDETIAPIFANPL